MRGRGVEKVGRAIGYTRCKTQTGIMGGNGWVQRGGQVRGVMDKRRISKTKFCLKNAITNLNIVHAKLKKRQIVAIENKHLCRTYKRRHWGRGAFQSRACGERVLAELGRKHTFSTQMCSAPLDSQTD